MKYFIAIALIAAVASAGVIKPIIGHAQEVQQVQEILNAINSPSTDPATAVLLEQMLNDMFVQKPVQVGPAVVEQNPAVVGGVSPIAVGAAAPAAEIQQVQEIINAINSPSTDPATAVLLEQMLNDILGQQPVQVGPAIVEQNPTDLIAVGPAIVEGISPIAVGPAIVESVVPEVNPTPVVVPSPAIVGPTPAVVGPTPAASETPMVQIIVNVNAAPAGNNPVSVIAPEAVVQPEVVAEPAVKPELVTVVDTPVIIPSPAVLPEPVQPVVVVPELVSVAEPVIPEPVAVAVPVIPEPVAVAVPVIPEPVAIAQPAFPIGVQPVVLPETLN